MNILKYTIPLSAMFIFLHGCLASTIIDAIHAVGPGEKAIRTITAEKRPNKSVFQMYVEDNIVYIDIMTIDELIYMLHVIVNALIAAFVSALNGYHWC